MIHLMALERYESSKIIFMFQLNQNNAINGLFGQLNGQWKWN